ncbi:hypothetical protein H4R19_006450 [Coemansia spiralis]|nr:hypothetical protein H4R19_006450 [Coemansia spiralis]
MKAAALLVLCVASGVGVGARSTSVDPDDDTLSSLLGVRPDLVEMLGADGSNGGSSSISKSDVLGTGKLAEMEGRANEQAGCVSECQVADLGCRAQCMGVPGAGVRRAPRKEDISGNLPLNWRMQRSGGRSAAGRSADDMAKDDMAAAAGRAGAVPRLIAVAVAVAVALLCV